jgi:hypothetical protein
MCLFPPWKLIPQVLHQITAQKNTRCSTGNTLLDDTVLLSNVTEDETHQSAIEFSTKALENDRMAVINHKRREFGIDDATAEFFVKTHRRNTHKVYNFGWKKWITWCQAQQPSITPTNCDKQQVLRFLMEHRYLSTQHLSGLRSAITSFFKVLHPNKKPIASQDIIVTFFAAKRHSEIRIPSTVQLTTWGSDIMVRYIKIHWSRNQELSLFDLQLKAIFVLSPFSSARSRSELGGLQYRDIQFKFRDSKVHEMVIFFRERKKPK